MRRIVPIALAVVLVGCSTAEAEDVDRCRDSGSIVLWADPSEQVSDTMMIGCVSPEKYAEMFDTYTKIEEVSDD